MVDRLETSDAIDLAIKDRPIRKYITLIALKTISRFYKSSGPCVPISSRIIVKKGSHVNLAEAATMAFVGAETKIPVPRVHCSFNHRKTTYIVMERMCGQTLADALPSLSDADVERIALQLREMLNEMRAIPAPGNGIENCVGGSLRDSRIPHPNLRFGPFSSVQTFHEWLREGLVPEDRPPFVNDKEWDDIKYMIAMQDRKYESPVFTHGNLSPSNIMVRDGNVEAIIDWEFSGWLPRYWEYTSVWLDNKTRTAWQGMAAKIVDPWPTELRMEIVRQRWWGGL